MGKVSSKELLNDPAFKRLKMEKWIVSVILGLMVMVLYYGFILLMAYNKPFFANKVTESITVGIPLGVFVLASTIGITAIYVIWANTSYDRLVNKVREKILR